MSSINERYRSAVRSRDLTVNHKTTRSDSDVLGAMGLAGRFLERGVDGQDNRTKPCPLAVPLARLLAGDNHASREIVNILAEMLMRERYTMRIRLHAVECVDMAMACLAWFRDGVCKHCQGRGKLLIPGTFVLGNEDCPACWGSCKVPFVTQFARDTWPLAAWLVLEMERALNRAGPAAMEYLSPRLDL